MINPMTPLFHSWMVDALLETLTQTLSKAALTSASMPNGTGKSLAIAGFVADHPGQVVHVELKRRMDAHQVIDKLLTTPMMSAPATPSLFAHTHQHRQLRKTQSKAAIEKSLGSWFALRGMTGASEDASRVAIVIDGAQWIANRNEISALIEIVEERAGNSYGGIALVGDGRFILPQDPFAALPNRRASDLKKYSLHESLIVRMDQVWSVTCEDITDDEVVGYLRHRGAADDEIVESVFTSMATLQLNPTFRTIDRLIRHNRGRRTHGVACSA